MIRRELYEARPDGEDLYRTYSDLGMMIEQETGDRYAEAIDVESTGHTYTETDEPIDQEELTDTEALNIIMGRDADESNSGEPVSNED